MKNLYCYLFIIVEIKKHKKKQVIKQDLKFQLSKYKKYLVEEIYNSKI